MNLNPHGTVGFLARIAIRETGANFVLGQIGQLSGQAIC
jgi:hypothetical protein